MYSNTRTLWIEPETGVLIKGQSSSTTTSPTKAKRSSPRPTPSIVYNDETVKDNVDTYKPLALQLKIVRVWVPLLGLVLGLALIGLGSSWCSATVAIRTMTAPAVRSDDDPDSKPDQGLASAGSREPCREDRRARAQSRRARAPNHPRRGRGRPATPVRSGIQGHPGSRDGVDPVAHGVVRLDVGRLAVVTVST